MESGQEWLKAVIVLPGPVWEGRNDACSMPWRNQLAYYVSIVWRRQGEMGEAVSTRTIHAGREEEGKENSRTTAMTFVLIAI